MYRKIRNKFMQCKFYLIYLAFLISNPSVSFALNLDGTDYNRDAKELTDNSINQIVNIFSYIGAFAIAIGIMQVILSIKDENADGKTRGMITAIVGFALVCMNLILKQLDFGY